MSTRLYKINGEYNTFEYWHDHYGYTRTPTFSVQYKTTNPWGAAFASGGYYDAEDLMDIFTFSFFVPGVVGWYSIDDLALEGYYPAAATDLTVARDSEVSNAATLTQDNETYYLVQNDIEYGWMSQAEFEARGWSTDVGDPPSYIVFDTSTGTIVHSIADEGMITVYETGVPVQSFYFTSNGENETQNTNISHADIPVYNEDGTAPAADTPYNGSSVLAFMDVDGNTKQADGESLYVDNGELRLDAPDTDEGEQWAALVESKDEFDIECNFGDTVTVPSGYRVKSVKSTDAFAFGHGTVSGSTVTVEYYGENTYSSDISQTDINTSGTPGMYMFQMNRNEFPIWGFKLIPNANVTSLSNISVNQNGIFVKLSGTSSSASTIATNANSYPGLFKYLNSSGTVVQQFFNVPSSLWKFENGTFSWLGNTSSPSDLAYWYYNDAPYAGIVVTLTNEPEPEPPAPSELTAYFTNQGAAGTEDTFIQNGITHTLYDSSGATIPYDPSKTYTKILLYRFDGTEMSPNGVSALDSDQGWCDTILKVRANGNKSVYKLTYTVS